MCNFTLKVLHEPSAASHLTCPAPVPQSLGCFFPALFVGAWCSHKLTQGRMKHLPRQLICSSRVHYLCAEVPGVCVVTIVPVVTVVPGRPIRGQASKADLEGRCWGLNGDGQLVRHQLEISSFCPRPITSQTQKETDRWEP